MSNRTRKPLTVVPEQEADEWEGERTAPGWAQRITISDLFLAMSRLERVVGRLALVVKWLAVSVAAMTLTTVVLWWIR